MAASEKFDKVDADAIVADERRTYAVKAERDAVMAAVDADAARRLRALVPDLRSQVEGQIVAAEQHEKRTRERANSARSRAGLTDADYPDLSAELGGRLIGLEESVVRWEERADDPELYAGHQTAQGHPDPAEFFRFQAANARAALEATRSALTQAKAASKTGRRGAQADKPE
jgi:hypothetical protein